MKTHQYDTMATKQAFSNNIGTANFQILSNAIIVNPNGERAGVVSASPNDSSAGTGIQKVIINYFDINWVLKSEVVTLNGTTLVLTGQSDIFRIESFEAYQVGSDQFASGTITLKSTDGTRLFAQIDPAFTSFLKALHFVKPGTSEQLIDLIASCPTSGGVMFLVFTTKDNTPDGGGLVLKPEFGFVLAGNSLPISLQVPVICDARYSVQGLSMGVAVKALSASQVAMASFSY